MAESISGGGIQQNLFAAVVVHVHFLRALYKGARKPRRETLGLEDGCVG